MPPGSKPLADLVEWIKSSDLPAPAKHDLRIWARWKATVYKDGEPWMRREDVARVSGMIGRK